MMVASLDEFAKRIAQELSRAGRPSSPAATPAEYVLQLKGRRCRFRGLAEQLLSQTVRPRVTKLAEQFVNAKIARAIGGLACTCWIGYSQQCPANIKLEFSFDHDEQINALILSYLLHITPSFTRYDRHDRLVMPMQGLSQDQLGNWVEDKLIGFLHAFQRLDRFDHGENELLVTDPVCGTRLHRSSATEQVEYKGHAYCFCTEDCRQEFAAEPQRFVIIDLKFVRWSLAVDIDPAAEVVARRAA